MLIVMKSNLDVLHREIHVQLERVKMPKVLLIISIIILIAIIGSIIVLLIMKRMNVFLCNKNAQIKINLHVFIQWKVLV